MDLGVLLLLSLALSLSWGQTNIQDIKLVNSNYSYAGNIRILYNGTWGTICDYSWDIYDARVACRMLGYTDAACALSNSQYGIASSSVPIWMSNLGCNGRENYLDVCPFYGWGPDNHYCRSHYDDAGVVCINASSLEVPELSVINTNSKSITLNWPGVTLFSDVYWHRYIIQYNTTGYSSRYQYTSYSYYGSTPRNNTVTISNLLRNTIYSISIRQQFRLRSSRCYYYNYIYSMYSMPIVVSTSNTVPPSQFGVRLISPISGLNFLGRVEVYYRNIWGTVCDYSFGLTDANVICNMLNFTRAICAVTNARLGRGSGKIWLNRLTCSSSDEILDDCGYTTYTSSYYYSSYYCRSNHYDDAGVVCLPQDPESVASAPLEFNATSTSTNTILFSWRRVSYITFGSSISWRLVIEYTRSDYPGRTYNLYPTSSYSTSYTFRNVIAGVTINATIRVQGRLTRYYCYTYLNGASSDNVAVTTIERPPSGPPLNFHIAVVNCSAIHTEWSMPSYYSRNGLIRGYKVMYKAQNSDEEVLDLSANVTEYVIGNLTSSTIYEVTVLAYTVGDGPRSIFLTAQTNDENICQTDVIDFFGINGNDIDKTTVYSYSSNLNIFCGSKLPNVQIDWLFSNGTKVGITNRNIREGHYLNGTTVLQMGRFGRISICDADTYMCRANQTTTGRAQQRTFMIKFTRYPPVPGIPVMLNVTSTTATIGFTQPTCDGNHPIQNYNIRVSYYRIYYYFSRNYRNFNNIDVRLTNYTISGLNSLTSYYVSVQAQGQNGVYSSYSSSLTITTLRPVPSPPRAVNVELVAPNIIFVTWVRPSVVNGRLLYYTVYATPLISQLTPTIRTKRQTQSLQTVSKNFSYTTTSGNLTLPQLGVEYHVQVRATTLDNTTGINRQTLLSTLTPNSTIFVPIQGLPSPQNVRVLSTSNTTITLSWTTPLTNDTITGYFIEYTAMIEGKSPLGNLIQYTHSGNTTVPTNANRVVLDPLLPQTNYLFRVAVLTTRGEGMQVQTRGSTDTGVSDFERYVYFHLRFGPVFNCPSFRQDIDGREEIVKKQIYNFLKASCNCGLTEQHITGGQYSCGQLEHQIIYRAQILGTKNYSASNLVDLLQNWIGTGKAYFVINPFQMILDSTCPTRLDLLNDPECPVIPVEPHTGPTPIIYTKTSDKTTTKPKVQPQELKAGIPSSTVGGFFVGAIIIILLLVLIILIIGIVLWKVNKGHSPSSTREGRTRDGRDVFGGTSTIRFNQFENSDNDYEKKDLDEKIQDF